MQGIILITAGVGKYDERQMERITTLITVSQYCSATC